MQFRGKADWKLNFCQATKCLETTEFLHFMLYYFQDKSIIVWSSSSGRRLYKLEGHIDEIASIKLRGSFAVSTSWDESARMWNVDAGTCTQVLLGHTEVE